jgi:hypothetical protein
MPSVFPASSGQGAGGVAPTAHWLSQVSSPEAGVDAAKGAADRHQGPHYVLHDPDFVAVGIRQPRAGRKRGSVDPVEAGARHLNELELSGRRAHLAGERHGDQYVHLEKLRADPGSPRPR